MLTKIMTKDFITFKETDTVKQGLDSLTNNQINGAPVLNSENKLVGIIVKADLFRFLIEDGHYDTCPIEWVMTKKVIVANEEEDYLDVIKRVRQNNIAAIPIVDSNMQVKGMITLESIVDSFIDK
ncbi:MAG: CBS domain-containing protein [Clostridium sp.]